MILSNFSPTVHSFWQESNVLKISSLSQYQDTFSMVFRNFDFFDHFMAFLKVFLGIFRVFSVRE